MGSWSFRMIRAPRGAAVPNYLPSVPVDPTSGTGLPLQYRCHDAKSAMVLRADHNGPDLKGGSEETGRGYRIYLNNNEPVPIEGQ